MADINLGVGGANSATGGYDIENSAAFGGANGIQFNPSSDGNRRTWTVSLWVKRSELSVQTTIFGANNTNWTFMSTDWLRFGLHTGSAMYYYDTDNTGTVFRDTSAWYHLVFQLDTTQAAAANRTKLYINGELYTGARGGADTSANIPQNTEMTMSLNTTNIQVGYFYSGGAQLDGYMSEIHFTDGVANDADAFGEYDNDSGIWKPKAYEGSYGTNGFYLEFKEPAASSTGIGKDTSGNGHNFFTGGAYPSQATDTPTNNFCTMNPLLQNPVAITPMTEGATFITGVSSSTNWESRFGTFAVTAGKWYTELKADGAKYTNNIFVGYCGTEYTNNHYNNHLVYAGAEGALAVYSFNGDIYGGTGVHGFRIYDGDVVAMMLDADNGAMYFKNLAGPNSNVSEGTITWSRDGTNTADPTSGASKTGAQIVDWDGATVVAVSLGNNVGGIEMNFGGYNIISNTQSYTDENGYGSFVMQPPTGYYALCTKNLAEYG